MQVWNVLQVAHWKYGTQKLCKNRHLSTIAEICRAISSQLRHVLTIGKKPVKQQYLLQMSLQYGELRPTNGWDRLAGLGHPIIFQRVSRLGSVTARQSSSGRQPNCGVEQRVPPMFSRVTITLGIGPHSSSVVFSSTNLSGQRLDVYQISTHGVALVRIRIHVWNVLHTARWKYRT